MADVNLQAVITAKDEASATVKSFSDQLKASREGLLAVGAAAGVAFAGIAAFANDTIKSANESAAVQAQLNAVLTSTHGAAGLYIADLNDQAQALQRMTTYSDEAVGSAQALLLTFTNIKGPVFQSAIGTILDMSTALGQDLKSSAIQVGKALNDPVQGITALSRVGVSFTQEQKDMIQSLVETGQTVKAQQIILGELSREFGGSATAAASTFEGKQKQLANQIDDVKETIGNALIPVLQSLLTQLVPIVSSVAEWIAAHPELTKWIIIITGAVTGLVAVMAGLALILPVIIAGFTFLFSPIGLIIAAIAAVVAGTILLVTHWSQVKEFFAQVWAGVQKTFSDAIRAILDFFQPLISMVDSLIEKVRSIGSAIAGAAGAVGSFVGNTLGGVIGHAGGGSVNPYQTYLVGENGPELFRPGTTGAIIPNGAFAGAGGGNLTINVTGTFLSQDAAERVGDMIVDILKRKTRLGY